MTIPTFALVIGAVGVLIVVGVLIMLRQQAKQVNLTRPNSPDEKPAWLRDMPPKETVDATRADGEGITLYDYDEGEQVAAPFAEQIEDILLAHMKTDPALAGLKVDLGTSPDGELAVWVDDKCYTDVSEIPHEPLRQAIEQAIAKWEKGH